MNEQEITITLEDAAALALATYEARREAYADALQELQEARARLAQINRALPDVLDTDKRKALKAERARIMTLFETAPDELGELARLVCLAELERVKTGVEEVESQLEAFRAELDKVEVKQRAFLNEREMAIRMDRFGQNYEGGMNAMYADLGQQGQALDAESKPLAAAICQLEGKRGGLDARARQYVGGSEYRYPATWARTAHQYGEKIRLTIRMGNF